MEVKVAPCTVTAEILDAVSTSQTVYLCRIPVNAYILHCVGRVKTAFAGVTAPTISVGTSTGTSDYMPTQPINIANALLLSQREFCPVLHFDYQTATERSIVGTFSSSSGNFADLTAGELEIVIVYTV